MYLNFDGQCKSAFTFYHSILGGEISEESTFGDMPTAENMPPIEGEDKNKIMHMALMINEHTLLMGCDVPPWSSNLVAGNNFSISIHPENTKEADRIFAALAEGGEVRMPLEKTFWNAYFGMVTDQFGIQWMINVDL